MQYESISSEYQYQYPVLGFHGSWSQYLQIASKQPRRSQVLPFTPCFPFYELYTSSSLFRFSDKGTKETENSAQK